MLAGVGSGHRPPAAALASLVLTQSVKRSHFIGQSAQRGHLHIAVMRNLRHLLVIFAQIFFILAKLIEALGLQQHPRIRAGQSNDRKGSHQRGGHKSIDIAKRQGNLANLPVFIPRNK